MALNGEMENKKAGKYACRWLMQELRARIGDVLGDERIEKRVV
jgi:hypothetical protein